MVLPSLTILWLAAAAHAQPNMSEAPGPATSAPKSGNCGLQGSGVTEAAIKGHIEDVFTEVWNAAGVKGSKPPLIFKPYDPDKIASTTHVNEDITIPELAIIVYLTICEIAHSDDEVAAVLAHELGHVELRHGPQLEAMLDKLEAKCGGCDKECCMSKIHEASMPLESVADKKAVDYLGASRSRFKPEAAISIMRRMKDQEWAQGITAVNVNHPPLMQRAYELAEWIKRKKK